MSNKALEALRMKHSFSEWWQGNIGTDFAETLLRAHDGRSEWEISQRSPLVAAAEGDASRLASGLGSWLRNAYTYWIDRDMLTLVNNAAPTMPDQALHKEDAPHEFGFVLFEDNIYLNVDDPRETEKIGARALAWRQATYYDTEGRAWPGYEMWWFSDRYDRNDTLFRTETWSKFFSLTGKVREDNFAAHMHRLVVSHYATMAFGQDHCLIEDWRYSDRYRRWLMAFWALVKQPVPGRKSIVMQAEVEPDRALKRQLVRDSLPVQMVTFITLRHIKQRKKEENEGTRLVNWTHRWLVDGFWRNQFYPSENIHRQIYIDPYIKGPEGLPLRMKEKIYRWVR